MIAFVGGLLLLSLYKELEIAVSAFIIMLAKNVALEIMAKPPGSVAMTLQNIVCRKAARICARTGKM
jgi:hypothetical protein